MAHIGYGYGSEWHLLYYLARRRGALTAIVERAVGARELIWLDHEECSERRTGGLHTREQRGLEFLDPRDPARLQGERSWPQSGNVHNWDAVGRCMTSSGPSWLLLEAKAHLGELKSSCGATSDASRAQIQAVLEGTRRALGVVGGADWAIDYYQLCNRLALLHHLDVNGVRAHLVQVCFTGDRADLGAAGRNCPASKAGWLEALASQERHVGLPDACPLRRQVHEVFLPAYSANVAEHLLRPEYNRAPAGQIVTESANCQPPSSPALARQFDEAMMQIYLRAKSEAGYNATRFLQMLQQHGGIETAKKLLPHMSDGFSELWQRSRLDLTVEALILEGRWAALFSDAERQMARDRLRQCGMAV